MSSDLLHIISYLAGFSLPFFGTVFGKLLIQLHIDVFIICQKRGTDLAQKLILFVAPVCVCVCPHVCVCTKKSPPECSLFKDCLRGITSDSLCTSLCTQCSSSFLHLTLSCLNLLLKWLSWSADMLIWKLWSFYTMKTHWKAKEWRAGAEPLWQNINAYFIYQICNSNGN